MKMRFCSAVPLSSLLFRSCESRLHVVVDPVDKVAGLGVDTGVAGLGASIAPGHHSGQLVAAHEWAARVTLAGVLASLVQAGADHRGSDGAGAVGVTAVLVRHHGHSPLLKARGKTATL